MKLKVCGMRDSENIRQLMELKPDFMGMIFYPKSARYVMEPPDTDIEAECVGVFVNASIAEITDKASRFDFHWVQLHGDESPETASQLKFAGFQVIKAVSISESLPVEQMLPYEPFVDFFLFDTKTPQYGGSGVKFDWEILRNYTLEKPFFLSGGIDLDDVQIIKDLKLEKLYAIDVNSRFELEPALKDIEKIKALKAKL